MSDFKEIVPPDYFGDQYSPTEDSCPKCSNRLYSGPVQCPDGKVGCLVLHHGYKCLKCGGMFEKG